VRRTFGPYLLGHKSDIPAAMTAISVYSRAHRALRDTPRFEFADDKAPNFVGYRQRVESKALGEVIGWYKNPEPVQPEAILVAERGLLSIGRGIDQCINFSDIRSVAGPGADTNSSNISIVLKSGIAVLLPIAGRDGKYRDVFSFIRFLNRVTEDAEPR